MTAGESFQQVATSDPARPLAKRTKKRYCAAVDPTSPASTTPSAGPPPARTSPARRAFSRTPSPRCGAGPFRPRLPLDADPGYQLGDPYRRLGQPPGGAVLGVRRRRDGRLGGPPGPEGVRPARRPPPRAPAAGRPPRARPAPTRCGGRSAPATAPSETRPARTWRRSTTS